MNTAIEATYNINVPQAVSLAHRAPPLAGISLPPTLSRGSIQNGHINLIISSVIRLADEERLGTDVGYPYQEWCQCSLLCSLCYARLGPAPRRSSDGYRTLSSYSSPCLPGTPACSVCRVAVLASRRSSRGQNASFDRAVFTASSRRPVTTPFAVVLTIRRRQCGTGSDLRVESGGDGGGSVTVAGPGIPGGSRVGERESAENGHVHALRGQSRIASPEDHRARIIFVGRRWWKDADRSTTAEPIGDGHGGSSSRDEEESTGTAKVRPINNV
ncbi:uncharacterized protein LOC144471439 [Augochlora pura]